jgi:peptide/nickel transport system substrate-binding protein
MTKMYLLRRHGKGLVAIMLTSLLLFTGLPPSAIGHAEAASKTTLIIGMIEAIDSLNPLIGVNDNAYIFYGLIYDYLMSVDQDKNIKPNLATSWYIIPDQSPYGSVWQYNLTRNATWHDGEPFDVDDVIFTINYQIGTNYDSMWAYQPYTRFMNYTEKIDQYTVRIHFKDLAGNAAPCPFGNAIMMPILPKHIWADINPYDAGFSYANYFPIGTGPFMCTEKTKNEFISGEQLILLRTPDYHGEADYGTKVQFDRLIIKTYLEPAAMLIDIEKGSIDLAGFNAPNYRNLMDWLERNPTDNIGHYAGPSTTAYSNDILVSMFNGNPNATNPLRFDPAVRQAMAHAINREFIKDSIFAGYADIGSTIIPPTYGDYYWQPGPDEIYDFNVTKANQILDAAGYAWNSDHTKRYAGAGNAYAVEGKQLKFKFTAEQELVEDRDTVNYLLEEWANIGIEIVPDFVNTVQWNTVVYSGVYDLATTYWSGDPDPNYLLFIQSKWAIGGWSENWYSSPYYDANFSASEQAINHAERKGYIFNCSKIMYQDAAFITTVYGFGCYAWRNDTFSGWGDWGAHPARSLSSYWSANDLYFDLVPLKRQGGGINTNYILIGLGVAVAAAVIVVLMLRKRGEKEEEVRLP